MKGTYSCKTSLAFKRVTRRYIPEIEFSKHPMRTSNPFRLYLCRIWRSHSDSHEEFYSENIKLFISRLGFVWSTDYIKCVQVLIRPHIIKFNHNLLATLGGGNNRMSRYYSFIVRSFYTFREKNMQELKKCWEHVGEGRTSHGATNWDVLTQVTLSKGDVTYGY
jgi:hypothetical protein